MHRLREMAAKGELLFPAINVNDCVTKSKFVSQLRLGLAQVQTWMGSCCQKLLEYLFRKM